jgi:hypothetical protein
MGRQVVTQKDLDLVPKMPAETAQSALGGGIAGVEEESASTATNPPTHSDKLDQFTDRLLKYIPAEVVVVYVSVEGLIRNAPADVPREKVLWCVFFFLLAGTWVYLTRVQKVSKKTQLLISTLAFAVWVFSLGGPFVSFSWYKPFYGTVLLPLYTFGISAIKAESPVPAGP